jgi:hypothetical protein
LFGKPKIPKAIPPEPAPSPLTVNEDVVDLQTRDRLRRKKGRASTVLTDGGSAPTGVGIKTALGR